MASFSKFLRPDTPSRGLITDRDLDIIEAILRYRFSPASELLRLVSGNEDVTHRRLRRLWECGLINRFAFPTVGSERCLTYRLPSPTPFVADHFSTYFFVSCPHYLPAFRHSLFKYSCTVCVTVSI
jgi:hypothetical protein